MVGKKKSSTTTTTSPAAASSSSSHHNHQNNNNNSNDRQQKAKKYRHAKKKQPHKMKPHGERKQQQQQQQQTVKIQQKKQHQQQSASKPSSSTTNTNKYQNEPKNNNSNSNSNNNTTTTVSSTSTSSSSSIMSKLSQKLVGAKFRMINEQLYTTTGAKAKEMFEKNPELYHEYHTGFRSSIEQWPFDPVSNLLSWLAKKSKKLVVADFGCGDARIAREAKQLVIHSFDLVASNELVTACDMSRVPLPNESVDIGIFSLSLMGTNFVDYLKEAYRVLKRGATLKIVELESRFLRFEPFKKLLQKLGFDLQSQLNPDHYFVIFEYRKNESRQSLDVSGIDPLTIMKPCLYKNR